jgi:hypothetical protein
MATKRTSTTTKRKAQRKPAAKAAVPESRSVKDHPRYDTYITMEVLFLGLLLGGALGYGLYLLFR